MNRSFGVTTVLSSLALALGACASQHLPPQALVDARAELTHAHDGVAARLDPTDLHEADLSLQNAEKAWRDSPDDPSAVDLALIANNKARIAEAEAEAMKAQQQAQAANGQVQSMRTAQLDRTQQALGVTEAQLQQEQANSAAQREKLQQLETNLKDARDSIAKIASVKDDDRGMVITLPGEVLFKTGKFDLKPGAMAKLDEIGQALKGKEQPIVVYGYTDNVGTLDTNTTLSQNRAQAVRDYLVSKGIPQDLVTAQGKGPADPIADNTSVEGRAQNRRVEIVVQPKK